MKECNGRKESVLRSTLTIILLFILVLVVGSFYEVELHTEDEVIRFATGTISLLSARQ